MTRRRPHLLFLNRSYYPDTEATGQLLTELCEQLSNQFDVTVITGQPNYDPQNRSFRRWGTQVHRGVTICRVWHTRFPKRFLPLRAINLLTYLTFAWFAARRLNNRPDIVIAETDPPLLCLLGSNLKQLYKCHFVVYLQDLYPDLAVALGHLQNNLLTRWIKNIFVRAYRRSDQIIVLSEDMRQTLIASGLNGQRIVTIPNWTDCAKIRPIKHDNAFRRIHSLSKHSDGLSDKFVVMYSGNIGMCQGLENVLAAAQLLVNRPEILFLLIGNGAKRKALERTADEQKLTNVRFMDYQPQTHLSESLSAADVHLVPLDPRITRYLMPSKLYGALASGTAVIAVAPPNCELAQIVEQNEVGFVVPPNSPGELAALLESIANHPGHLAYLGTRARQLAEAQFDREMSVNRFAHDMNKLLSSKDDQESTTVGPELSKPAARMSIDTESQIRA